VLLLDKKGNLSQVESGYSNKKEEAAVKEKKITDAIDALLQ
jgi:hypothetical protein